MSNNNTKRGPGRPPYEPIYPKHTPFSFREFCLAQGMEFKARSGQYIKSTGTCTPLTLRKFMDNRGCPVVEVPGLYAEPLSKRGLGRKAFMLALRDGFTPAKTVAVARVSVPVEAKDETATVVPAKRPRKAKAAKVQTTGKAKRKYTRKATVNTSSGLSPETQALEDIKAALAAPTLPPETPAPAPVATVPVVNIPAATPTPAPAAQAPAPAAAAPTAPVAETVAA